MSVILARSAFSLMEVLAAVVLIGMVAILIVPRLSGASYESRRNACFSNKGDIEVQVQRWWRTNGSPPAANLAIVGSDTDYFPEGLPTCPLDNLLMENLLHKHHLTLPHPGKSTTAVEREQEMRL